MRCLFAVYQVSSCEVFLAYDFFTIWAPVPRQQNLQARATGLSPLALFAMELHGNKKELKQWLNPWRKCGIVCEGWNLVVPEKNKNCYNL